MRNPRKSKPKRKKIKFKMVSFMLSEKQNRSLNNYCKARKTTPIKLIKKSIFRYINAYDLEVPKQYFVSERQLELFNEEKGKNLSPLES